MNTIRDIYKLWEQVQMKVRRKLHFQGLIGKQQEQQSSGELSVRQQSVMYLFSVIEIEICVMITYRFF